MQEVRRVKRLFLCEFITGGGLVGEPIPSGLAGEGELMLRAVVSDLLELGGFDLTVARDARLPPLALEVNAAVVMDSPWDRWTSYIRETDLVLPIAPETAGVLERLNRLTIEHGKVLLGCAPDAVAIAASKLATARRLEACGIAVPPTVPLGQRLPTAAQGWVVKPDDGAGSEDTFLVTSVAAVARKAHELGGRAFVVQPYLQGEPMSLSLLCTPWRARVLACNRQIRQCDGERLRQTGTIVNAAAARREEFDSLAQAMIAALPGLHGYVGVDFVDTAEGPIVLDVNPRLTTAYAGLSGSLGANAAALILRTCQGAEDCTDMPLGGESCELAGHA
ncbi:MAG: ATP-grasp domain-containing protein [Chromatiales bacterium]